MPDPRRLRAAFAPAYLPFFLEVFLPFLGTSVGPLHAPQRIMGWPRSSAALAQEKHFLALQKMQFAAMEPRISA